MIIWVIISLLIVSGVCLVLFTKNIAELVEKASLYILNITPWITNSKKKKTEIINQWRNSELYKFELIWIWGVRIFGIVFIIAGIYILIIIS